MTDTVDDHDVRDDVDAVGADVHDHGGIDGDD